MTTNKPCFYLILSLNHIISHFKPKYEAASTFRCWIFDVRYWHLIRDTFIGRTQIYIFGFYIQSWSDHHCNPACIIIWRYDFALCS